MNADYGTARGGMRCQLPTLAVYSEKAPNTSTFTTPGGGRLGGRHSQAPDTWAEKFESFERTNSIRVTNGNFDSCNSCKQLVPSRLHELHESKVSFVTHVEFIRSKLSNFLLTYPGSQASRGSKKLLSLGGGGVDRGPQLRLCQC